MNKKILFSPVGGTDPISQQNCRDGSMLHICRFEKPDKVVLYLSNEMIALEEKDHRYSYALERLMEHQGRTFEVEMIKRPDLVDVQDFDVFYPEFSDIINRIMWEEMDETDSLILNISSGTPAMKSALAVLKTLDEIPCRLIQVVTPAKKQNVHDNRGFDPKDMWELDEDNEPDAENRCADVTLPSLAVKKKEEVIRMHVRAYDYHAALQVAESLPEGVTGRYLGLLRMAAARIDFDLSKVGALEKSSPYKLPVRRSDICRRFEYALILQVKLKRKEYADFIRAITPLIADLFEKALEERCGIAVEDFCYYPENDGKRVRKWSDRKLNGVAGHKIMNALQEEYEGAFNGKFVYSDHLRAIIKRLSTDEGLVVLTERLRKAEAGVRNLAAHEMDSFDDVKIRELTGQSADSIMKDIRSYFGYAGYKIPKEAWDSYEEMNEVIVGAI